VTVPELKRRLANEGFRPDVYGIDGSVPTYEGLVLERRGAQWTIEHFERGIRRELESFAGEEEACERMYQLLTEYFR
jgi:hypothetical protein